MERFELFKALMKTKRAFSLFPSNHPLIQERVKYLLEIIKNLIEQENKAEISIIEQEVFINEYSLRQESLEFADLIKEIKDTGITIFNFQQGITTKEVISLINYLNESKNTPLTTKLLSDELRTRGITHITLSTILPLKLPEKKSDLPVQLSEWGKEYQKIVSEIENIFGEVSRGKLFPPENIHLIVQRLLKQVIKEQSSLNALFNMKGYDDCTFRHSINVAILSLLMGKELKFDQKLLATLGEVALLHDIGKVMMPEDIISKTGSLNAMEWEMIYRHPFVGAEILLAIPGINPLTPCVAMEHHIRHDGGGYPHLEITESNNYLTPIVSICDFYDAMTTIRSYRKPLFPHQAVLLLLQGANTQFNPVLVKVFVSLVGFYPIGTIMQTDRGEMAITKKVNPNDPLHPIIEIIKNEAGEKIPPKLIDTSEKDQTGKHYLRNISQILKPQSLPLNQDLKNT